MLMGSQEFKLVERLLGLRRFRSAKKAQTITGQRVNLDLWFSLIYLGFSDFGLLEVNPKRGLELRLLSICFLSKSQYLWFFVTWYGSIGGHKSTKSLSGKRFNWLVRSRSKTVDKNRSNTCLYKGFIPYNPVHCIRQTEEPYLSINCPSTANWVK